MQNDVELTTCYFGAIVKEVFSYFQAQDIDSYAS